MEKRIDATDMKIIRLLQKNGRMSNTEIAKQTGVSETTVRYRLQRLLREDFIQIVAMVNPLRLGFGIEGIIRIKADIKAIDHVAEKLKVVDALYFVARSMGASTEEGSDDAPIVRLVTRMFQDALAARASDIHVEPSQGSVRVRFRVDGMLREVAEHPRHLAAPLISRLKIMAKMDIAEKRKPQDGRIGMKLKGRDLDVRASILPTNHGETMVMRLLDRSSSLIGLRELGFEEDDYNWFKELIKRPNGIVLVTGPTGSGKTTSLYAALAGLNRPDTKIITAEDPVEYDVDGIQQVTIQPEIGVTYGAVLRAVLRQDPDKILVGEIRDEETAAVAVEASLTGHTVFSTLHTNDAPSAVTRLVDIGVQPFMITATLEAVVAQRLIRRICADCKQSFEPDEETLRELGPAGAKLRGSRFYYGAGCEVCHHTGYRGRTAIFEVMMMTEELRKVVLGDCSTAEIRREAFSSGMTTLRESGLRALTEGRTTVEEVLRETMV